MRATPPNAYRYTSPLFFVFFIFSCTQRESEEVFIENNRAASENLFFLSKSNLGLRTIQSTPVRHENTYLIVGDNGYLSAYDTDTKTARWRKPLQITWARPSIHKKIAYIGSGDGYLYGLRIQDGRIVLRLKLHGPANHSAVIADDTLYITAQDGYLRNRSYVYSISLTEKKERWNYRLEGENKHGLCVAAGWVIATDDKKNVYALEQKDGGLTWKKAGVHLPRAAPVFHKKHLYLTKEEGHIEAINLQDMTSSWQFKADTIVSHTPLFADTSLYFGDWKGSIYALHYATGKVLWKHKTPVWFYEQPILTGENLYFCGYNGVVISMNTEEKTLNWRLQVRGITDMLPLLRQDTMDMFTIRGSLYTFNVARVTPNENKK